MHPAPRTIIKSHASITFLTISLKPFPLKKMWFNISMVAKTQPLNQAVKKALLETAKDMLNPPTNTIFYLYVNCLDFKTSGYREDMGNKVLMQVVQLGKKTKTLCIRRQTSC